MRENKTTEMCVCVDEATRCFEGADTHMHTHVYTFRSFFLQIQGCFAKPLGSSRGFYLSLYTEGVYYSPHTEEAGEVRYSGLHETHTQRSFTEPLDAFRGFVKSLYRGWMWSPIQRRLYKALGSSYTCMYTPMHILVFFLTDIWGV